MKRIIELMIFLFTISIIGYAIIISRKNYNIEKDNKENELINCIDNENNIINSIDCISNEILNIDDLDIESNKKKLDTIIKKFNEIQINF